MNYLSRLRRRSRIVRSKTTDDRPPRRLSTRVTRHDRRVFQRRSPGARPGGRLQKPRAEYAPYYIYIFPLSRTPGDENPVAKAV